MRRSKLLRLSTSILRSIHVWRHEVMHYGAAVKAPLSEHFCVYLLIATSPSIPWSSAFFYVINY